MYTLLQELRRTGPDNPALSMLVEPLLPRAWRQELDRQKLLIGDEDTDLYSAAIAQERPQRKVRTWRMAGLWWRIQTWPS